MKTSVLCPVFGVTTWTKKVGNETLFYYFYIVFAHMHQFVLFKVYCVSSELCFEVYFCRCPLCNCLKTSFRVFKSCFQYFEPNQPISITFTQWICDESGGCSRVWRPQAATRPFKQERLKRGNSLDLTYLCFLPPPSWLTALWSDVAPHI